MMMMDDDDLAHDLGEKPLPMPDYKGPSAQGAGQAWEKDHTLPNILHQPDVISKEVMIPLHKNIFYKTLKPC